MSPKCLDMNTLPRPVPYRIPDYFNVQTQLDRKIKLLGKETMTLNNNRGVIIPYSVLTGLALLNAKDQPIPTATIYEFITEYFPNCGNHSSNSCKSSIRNALCKYDFVMKVQVRRSDCFDWQLDKSKAHKFTRILKLFEGRNQDPRTYGLKNIEDWPLIRAGVKGLPRPVERRSRSPTKEATVEHKPSFLTLTDSRILETKSAPTSPTDLELDDLCPNPTSLPFGVNHITHAKLDEEHNDLSDTSPPQSPAEDPMPVKKTSPTRVNTSPPRNYSGMSFIPYGAPMATDPKLSTMQPFLPMSYQPMGMFPQMMMAPSFSQMATMPEPHRDIYVAYLKMQVDLFEMYKEEKANSSTVST